MKKQPVVIKHSFKKCGLSNNGDGSGNDLVVINPFGASIALI